VIAAQASQVGVPPPDSLRRAIREVFSRSEFRWEDSRLVLHWLGTLWLGFLDWLNAFQKTHPTRFALLLAVAIVALAAILVHFVYIALRILRPTLATERGPAPAGQPVDDVRAHLTRAAELAGAGRYTDALAHRFVALVLQLDARHVLRFRPSKTPAEYVGEAQVGAEDRAGLGALVSALYRHVFAAVPCDATTYATLGTLADRVGERVAPR